MGAPEPAAKPAPEGIAPPNPVPLGISPPIAVPESIAGGVPEGGRLVIEECWRAARVADGGVPDGFPVPTGLDGGVPEGGVPERGVPESLGKAVPEGMIVPDGLGPDGTPVTEESWRAARVPDGGVLEGGVPEGGIPEGIPVPIRPEGGVPEGGVPEGIVGGSEPVIDESWRAARLNERDPAGGVPDGGVPEGGVPEGLFGPPNPVPKGIIGGTEPVIEVICRPARVAKCGVPEGGVPEGGVPVINPFCPPKPPVPDIIPPPFPGAPEATANPTPLPVGKAPPKPSPPPLPVGKAPPKLDPEGIPPLGNPPLGKADWES